MIPAVLGLIDAILALIIVVLIVHVVLSWLISFEVVSRRNQFVGAIFTFTSAVVEPMVRPFRRLIPPIGNVDLSVLVLLLLIQFLRALLPWIGGLLVGSPLY
jgi:YggT family protein